MILRGLGLGLLLLLWPVSAQLVRSPEQLMQQGATLSLGSAQDLEAALEGNPEDLAARAKLLGFYYYQWMRPGEAESKAARRRHILWLIEHHPESGVTGLGEATIDENGTSMADPEGYRQARKLWLALMDSGNRNAGAFGNLARFFQITDKELAEKALLKAKALQPENREWDWRLGYVYGLGVLGVDAMGLNGQPTSADPYAQKGPFAERARKALAESRSGVMLDVAASILWRYGTILTPSVPKKLDFMDQAIQWIRQASAAEPGNPNWALTLSQLEASKRRLQPKSGSVQ
jgi:hypothetical protein